MKTIKNILLGCVLIAFTSCAKYVSTNYCTSTENIWKLEKDMSLAQINAVLGIEPYDIYINDQSHNKVLVYKYRIRTQDPAITNQSATYDSEALRNQEELFLSRDEKNLYVVLDSKTNKMLQYITDAGRSDAFDVQVRTFYFKNVLPEVINKQVK
jgi:hypothetical protein